MPVSRGARRALAAILVACALAWLFVFWTSWRMDAPLVRLMMPMDGAWSGPEVIAVWLMWTVMMAAMMLPSATPMILTHGRIVTQRGTPNENLYFGLAYFVVLAGFSVVATGLQWGLQSADLLTPMGELTNARIAGSVMILAGIVQWTPLKDRCLGHCRVPAGFFATGWRSGSLGAFRMGARHGITCLGCCWALMALLFVFGVMNLTAIVLLSTIVAAEKLLPHGDTLGRIGGGILVIWGLALIVH